MKKYISYLLISGLGSTLGVSAQVNLNFPCIDMGTASSSKPYALYSSKSRGSASTSSAIWLRMEGDCRQSAVTIPLEAQAAFEGIPRHSQSNLQDLIDGNVRISNQMIYPLETQFLKSPFYDNTGISREELFECLTGLRINKNAFAQSNVDYFKQLTDHIKYLEDELAYPYHVNGRKYQCNIIKSADDIDPILKSNDQMGWVLSVRGGHTLAPALYVVQDQQETKEFQQVVLDNIDRLKGIKPLTSGTSVYLTTPIFSMSFDGYFKDGLTGKVAKFLPPEQEAFEEQDLRTEITQTGQLALQRLVSKEEGRRILIDVAGMNLKSRMWYYGWVKERRYMKDSIPVLALGVGISGLKNTEGEYSASDEVIKNAQNTHLNNRQANLCRQDILEIIQSQGLVGISLERDKLMGKIFQTRYNAAVPGSAERRAIAVEAIIANICKFIQIAQTPEAWDMICISSNYDMFGRYLEMYDSSDDMSQLARDLYYFFSSPYEIRDMFTAKEIKSFMYKLSAEEIVQRLMYKNALRFMKKHLPKGSKK